MNDIQKSNAVNEAMLKLEGEYRKEDRPHIASRVRDARVELMASPDSAARLFDIIQSIAG